MRARLKARVPGDTFPWASHSAVCARAEKQHLTHQWCFVARAASAERACLQREEWRPLALRLGQHHLERVVLYAVLGADVRDLRLADADRHNSLGAAVAFGPPSTPRLFGVLYAHGGRERTHEEGPNGKCMAFLGWRADWADWAGLSSLHVT